MAVKTKRDRQFPIRLEILRQIAQFLRSNINNLTQMESNIKSRTLKSNPQIIESNR